MSDTILPKNHWALALEFYRKSDYQHERQENDRCNDTENVILCMLHKPFPAREGIIQYFENRKATKVTGWFSKTGSIPDQVRREVDIYRKLSQTIGKVFEAFILRPGQCNNNIVHGVRANIRGQVIKLSEMRKFCIFDLILPIEKHPTH